MKKRTEETVGSGKKFRKQVTKTLCVTMSVSMVAGQPMLALASDGVSAGQSAISQDISVLNDGTVLIPTAPMPDLKPGVVYKVPFRMYKAASIKEDNGQVTGEYSMGEICVKSLDAELWVEDNGEKRVKISLDPDTACTDFNYFNSKEDYVSYKTSEEIYLPSVQALKKGGRPENPKDGAVYTTEATSKYYECENAISSITFTLPSDISTIYFVVRAKGMGNGQDEQFGVLGFDYDNMTGEGEESKSPQYIADLKADVAAAKEISNADGQYSVVSYDKLQSAISDAEELLLSGQITEESAAEASQKLEAAKNGLVDLTVLKAKFEEADEIVKQTDKYTAASLRILELASREAKMTYYQEAPTKKDVERSIKYVDEKLAELVEVSKDNLDENNLEDGVYKVAVNLWNEKKDEESMGNDALENTATLTVKDGEYTLRVAGHPMEVMKMTGVLESLRIIPDGSAPNEEESNYKELKVNSKDDNYWVDIKLENPTAVSEYYYSGIKVHAVDQSGNIQYPMGKSWVDSRLRVSWESLSVEKLNVDVSELQEALKSAREIKNDDHKYSEGSFGKLQTAIADAEDLIGSKDITKEKVEKAVEDVNAAKDGLVVIDKLKAAIDEVEAKVNAEDKYTAASRSILNKTLKSAKTTYESANPKQKGVDNAVKDLETGMEALAKVAEVQLDRNNLKDGIYCVEVNLWNETSDDESMGNAALYHTATLTVKDRQYVLRVGGHQMVMLGMKGGLGGLRIIPDGKEPLEDESNYKEMNVEQSGEDYFINIPLENVGSLSDYYYSGIKVHVINKDGSLSYPMGQNWIGSRLRISWENLTLIEAFVDTTALEDTIKEAKTIVNTDNRYSAGSYNALQKAIQDGEALIDAEDITDEKVADSIKAIETAKKNLVVISDLKAVIDEAEAKSEQTDVYTAASLSKLKEALNYAKTYYYQEEARQVDVDDAKQHLESAIIDLVEISKEDLDKNHLEDGVYTVAVNLWHASQDKESMGNAALYHTATLTVEDGRYLLRVSGHQMTIGEQTGELDALRIVPNGEQPKGDGSNYVELPIQKDGSDYFIDIELADPEDVQDYYYAGIKVHTIDSKGNIGYPMGEGWINNRLRISWETLALKESAEKYPAFSAVDETTGITVTAPEGALPKGTKLRVTKISDQSKLESIDKTLSNLTEKNTPYQISLYVEKDGKEETIEPQNGMELTITLPIPAGYETSKLACYYIDENNYANMLKGAISGNTYTVANSKIGIYTVSEKKGREQTNVVPGKPGSDSTGRPVVNPGRPTVKPVAKPGRPTVKPVRTGDTANLSVTLMSMAAAMAAAAGALFFRKKKEDSER